MYYILFNICLSLCLWRENHSIILFPNMTEKQIRSAGRSCETVASFLLKTYEILQHPQFQHMISWQKDGIGFVVKDVLAFTKQILPKYFRHANFSSFVRQLNMYDFHKVKQQNDNLVFKNPLFRKGEQNQLKDIKRKASKKVFSHRRMPHERNHSQSQKYFSTLKTLKKSVQTQINQSSLNFQKSLSLLKDNTQSNHTKIKYIKELQTSETVTPLDSLFLLKEQCYRYFTKLQDWLSQNIESLGKKEQIVINCMNQLKKNKEEKKSVESFQSFPLMTSQLIPGNSKIEE